VTELAEHCRLIRFPRIELGARLEHAHARIASIRANDARLRRKTAAAAGVDVDREAEYPVDTAEHKVEARAARAGCVVRGGGYCSFTTNCSSFSDSFRVPNPPLICAAKINVEDQINAASYIPQLI
jgi:hypothetical protein